MPLLLSETKSNWSQAADEAYEPSTTHDMVAHYDWRPAQIGPPHYTYEVVVSFAGKTKVRAG